MAVTKKTEVTPEVSVSVTIPEAKKEVAKATNKKVKIVPNQTFKMVYGNKWYYFSEGTELEVSEDLKAYLKAQGALAVV